MEEKTGGDEVRVATVLGRGNFLILPSEALL